MAFCNGLISLVGILPLWLIRKDVIMGNMESKKSAKMEDCSGNYIPDLYSKFLKGGGVDISLKSASARDINKFASDYIGNTFILLAKKADNLYKENRVTNGSFYAIELSCDDGTLIQSSTPVILASELAKQLNQYEEDTWKDLAFLITVVEFKSNSSSNFCLQVLAVSKHGSPSFNVRYEDAYETASRVSLANDGLQGEMKQDARLASQPSLPASTCEGFSNNHNQNDLIPKIQRLENEINSLRESLQKGIKTPIIQARKIALCDKSGSVKMTLGVNSENNEPVIIMKHLDKENRRKNITSLSSSSIRVESKDVSQDKCKYLEFAAADNPLLKMRSESNTVESEYSVILADDEQKVRLNRVGPNEKIVWSTSIKKGCISSFAQSDGGSIYSNISKESCLFQLTNNRKIVAMNCYPNQSSFTVSCGDYGGVGLDDSGVSITASDKGSDVQLFNKTGSDVMMINMSDGGFAGITVSDKDDERRILLFYNSDMNDEIIAVGDSKGIYEKLGG